METPIFILICVAVVVIIFIANGIKIIPQSQTAVIERLGRYDRTLSSGLNIIIPFIERPREIFTRFTYSGPGGRNYAVVKTTRMIDLREQVYDFPKQSVITKDNVVTQINALLYFQIMDPMKAVYEIENLPNAIEKLTQTTLRNVVGGMELDQSLTSRDIINSKLRAVLDEATNKWGVKVTRVELQDITPPDSVRDAMEQQMQAERKRRAQILLAEGEKQSAILQSEGEKTSLINKAEAAKQTQILKAEGEAQAKILQANAEAQAIQRVAEAVAQSKTDPATYLLATKYINTLKEMVSGKDGKTVYIPYEASNLLGSIGSIKDMFKGN
ncbi:MAG: SPFH/Band 7/PHB domain protein [Bacteroidaceae bacterium]|nr:SPFH/Band 7/PHB domain protein [Bacteroidaceae bacterium]